MRLARGMGWRGPAWARWIGWLCVLSLALAVCAPAGTSSIRGQAAPAPAPLICADTACAAHGVRVYVEPDAGEAPITQAIAGATRSIWVERSEERRVGKECRARGSARRDTYKRAEE